MIAQSPTLQFVAFCLEQARGVGEVKLRSILARMKREHLSPEDLLRLDDHELHRDFALRPEAVAALRSPQPKVLEVWERLRHDSVQVLVQGHDGYPVRLASLLGGTAPPILYARGNTALFQLPAVGFCGSRKASDKGRSVARECANLLAAQGINVVSGYAHGVDLASHTAALEAGGTTTLVLPEGILHFRLKEDLRELVRDGDFSHLLVVSEFPPGVPWRAHNAMTRNQTICGLANALVVIESGLQGGTFEAGKTALKLNEPLFCVEYAEPTPSAAGNAYFLDHGAFSLKRARTGQPNLSKLLSVVHNGTLPTKQDTPQGELAFREESTS